MFRPHKSYVLLLTLLLAMPAMAGTPKQHPKVTPAPRMAVSAEPVSGRPVKRQNNGTANVIGPVMIRLNGVDMRLHGIRVPTESKIKPAIVEGHLRSLVEGQTLRCITVGIDMDGVPLVACEAQGITNIALKMLQSGFADVDGKQVANTPVAALYTQTSRMAREQKLAIWSGRSNVVAATAPSKSAKPAARPNSESQPTDQNVAIEALSNHQVVTSVSFPPIGLVSEQSPSPLPSQDNLPPQTEPVSQIGDDLTMPDGSAAAAMSDWMAHKLSNAEPASPPLRPGQTENHSGGWLLALGLVFILASSIGGYLSWRRHRAMMEEIAWTRSNALAIRRQANHQQIKRQKAAFNLEEDLIALSQMLSSRADIARLAASGPGGDTASDLRSLSIFVPDIIAHPQKIAAHLAPEVARNLRKIANSVQELEIRLAQCADLAAEGRLRDRPPALFSALAQRMDVIGADARSLSIALKHSHDEAEEFVESEERAYSPATAQKPVSGATIRTTKTARPVLSTHRHDGSSWGQPDWATI